MAFEVKMKRIILLCVLFVFCCALFCQEAQRNVFLDYYREPSPENFLNAYHFFTTAAEQDSFPDRAILYLMNLHKMESDNHLDYLLANIDNYRVGMKFQIANTLLNLRLYEKAIEIYEQVNESAPDWFRPWRRKGEAYLRLKEYPKAEIALKKSIEIRNTHFDAYLMLAEVCLLQKKNKLALENIEKAFEVQGSDPEDREEAYTTEETEFLYLKILQANKNKKANQLETELREKYPDDLFWTNRK